MTSHGPVVKLLLPDATPTAAHTSLAKASHVFLINTNAMAPSPPQGGYTWTRLS